MYIVSRNAAWRISLMQKVHSEKKQKKRNKRLLLQVGLIVWAIFLVILVATGMLVYRGSKMIYLQAKNEMIERDLNRVRESVLGVHYLDWMLDYCEAHPTKMSEAMLKEEPLTDDEMTQLSDYLSDKGFIGLVPDKPDPNMSKILNEAPEEIQFAMAKTVYQNFLIGFYVAQYHSNYDKMYCIDIGEQNRGFVFCGTDFGNFDDFEFGYQWDYPIEEHTAVQELTELSADEITDDAVFEMAKINHDNMTYYIGYAPIVFDGKIRCVICISFDWSAFRDAFMPYIIAMFVIGIAIILIAAGILLLFLHRSAIRPLRRILRAVRRYMEDKDSVAVVEAMGAIHTQNEFGVLSDDISELAEEIDRYNAENVRLAAEQEKVSAELSLAATIQRDMLPKQFPDLPQLDLYAMMTPAKEVGGDFYDFFMIDDDHIGLVVADVSGKGVPASLYMMMSMIVIRNYARAGKSPAEVLRKSNRSICENNDDKMFVTVWFGILQLSTGHVIAANAGHEYPIIRKPDGEFELLRDKHGFVLGGISSVKYHEYEIVMEKGSALFLYTDGAPEATDTDMQFFGTDRMITALNQAPDSSPKELIGNMTDAIDAFVGNAPQFDDLTMLCVKYNGCENETE